MSKKYFGTDGIRGHVGQFPINAEFILKLGWALGKALESRHPHCKVLIGKDTRISGYMFESALEAGLSAAGVDIHLLGPMPTPAIAYLTRTLRAQAGIVISASHNPYYDNGIKFFSHDGFKISDELEFAIENLLEQPISTVSSDKLGKAARVHDAPGRYIEFCKSTVPSSTSLAGMKIVLDCAHGASYHVAPSVYKELGAEVLVLNNNPNGLNINHRCGSTHPETLIKKVQSEQADLGIALDGDGDRVIMVDHLGNLLDGDELLYIMVKDRLERGEPVSGVVGTQMTNMGFEKVMQGFNIPFHRARVGDRYVMTALKERGWTLGGESSGHIVCLDLTTTGDGIISSLQVLRAITRKKTSLFELKQGFNKLPQVLRNVRLQNINSDLLDAPNIVSKIKLIESQLGPKGRILVRQSGTEPLLRIMIEGDIEAQIEQMSIELENEILAVL